MVFSKKLLMLCVSALAFLETQAATVTVKNSAQFKAALASSATDIVMDDGSYYPDPSPSQLAYTLGVGGFVVKQGTQKIRAKNFGKVEIVCNDPCSKVVSPYGIGLNVEAYAVFVSNGINIHSCSTGVWVKTGAYVNINQVTIYNNINIQSLELGAGMHFSADSVGVVKNSVIRDNNGNSGIYSYGNVTVQNSVITRNAANGIRLRYPPHVLKVQSSQIVDNYGGGIYVTETGVLKATDSNISANIGGTDGSGIGGFSSTFYIQSCTVKDNVGKPQSGHRAHGGVAMQKDSKYPAYVPIVSIKDSTVDDNTVLDTANNYTPLNIDVDETDGTVFTISNSEITAIAPVSPNPAYDVYESRKYCCPTATYTPTHQICAYPAVC